MSIANRQSSGYSSLKHHLRPSGRVSSNHSQSDEHPDVVRHIDLRSTLANEDTLVAAMGIIAQIQFKANRGTMAIGSMQLIEARDLAHMNSTLSEMAGTAPGSRIFSMEVTHDTRVSVVTPQRMASLAARICPWGAYVLVGAFGGLGEMIAELLVLNGAKTLVFLSRRGGEPQRAQELCEKMRKRGVEVITYAVDVADRPGLDSAWTSITRRVKVLGVVQCAAVLKV